MCRQSEAYVQQFESKQTGFEKCGFAWFYSKDRLRRDKPSVYVTKRKWFPIKLEQCQSYAVVVSSMIYESQKILLK